MIVLSFYVVAIDMVGLVVDRLLQFSDVGLKFVNVVHQVLVVVLIARTHTVEHIADYLHILIVAKTKGVIGDGVPIENLLKRVLLDDLLSTRALQYV